MQAWSTGDSLRQAALVKATGSLSTWGDGKKLFGLAYREVTRTMMTSHSTSQTVAVTACQFLSVLVDAETRDTFRGQGCP